MKALDNNKSIDAYKLKYRVGNLIQSYNDEFYTITDHVDTPHDLKVVCNHTYTSKVCEFYVSELDESRRSYRYYPYTFDELSKSCSQLNSNTLELSKFTEDERQSTELMSFNKNTYVTFRDQLEVKRIQLTSIIEFAKFELAMKLQSLNAIKDKLLNHIARINKIIFTIEIYLGIEENIVQIRSGKTSDEDDSIYLMQIKEFMDEQVGDPTDGGLDFKNVEDFDDWLCSYSNYFKMNNFELLVPFEKCVRILQVRRSSKNYSDNPFINGMINQANFETYILIRNGDNLYKIQTQLSFGDKLFPDDDELINVTDEVSRKEKFEIYKRNLIVMQGLVDRTDVFGQVANKINFLNGKSAENGDILFIYDNNTKISDGSEDVISFLTRARQCSEGSRVYYKGCYVRDDYKHTRFYNIYRKYYPDFTPDHGEYTLFIDPNTNAYSVTDHNVKYILFKPHVWSTNAISKKSYRFRVYSDEIIDIDVVSHRDLENLWNLMHDRRHRREYLKYMTELKWLMKFKNDEFAKELPFANLVMSLTGYDELTVKDAIFWWKTKNKWKRVLSTDDVKALRMITKKLNKGDLNFEV